MKQLSPSGSDLCADAMRGRSGHWSEQNCGCGNLVWTDAGATPAILLREPPPILGGRLKLARYRNIEPAGIAVLFAETMSWFDKSHFVSDDAEFK